MSATGKRAIVTGAASGIGQAVALRLLREGAAVVAADMNEAGLGPVVEAGATPFVGNLAVDADRDRLIATGEGADYLVNAAGIIRLKPILEFTVQDLRDIYAINVEATWDLVSRIGRTMPSGGAIVNLSSSSAKLATTTEAAVYASSKTAVLSITRSFAYAFAAQGVRVNAICPGTARTPMVDEAVRQDPAIEDYLKTLHPIGRIGEAEEIAEAAVWLCSPAASFVLGVALPVDGGYVIP